MALATSSMNTRSCVRVRAPAARGSVVVAATKAPVQAKAGIQTVTAAEAGQLIKDGWSVLDVRPPEEVAKVGIAGAVEAPMYIRETRSDPVNLIKRFATWSNGGWWVGGTHMIPNPTFVEEVTTKLPKDKGVVLACQTGVRSLAAADRLAQMGYSPLAWISGGLDEAKKGDLVTVPEGKDPRYGGIGGMSEQMGWTKVQEENKDPQFLGGVSGVLTGVAVVLALDLLSLGVEWVNAIINGPATP